MIRILEDPAVLMVDVAGAATMLESPHFLESASERVSHGVRSLRVDLRDCTTMDSTFSGTLLSLKRQLDRIGGTLTLVSPSARVLELLGQMGLLDFYCIEIADRTAGPWSDLAPAVPCAELLRRRILEAHEELAEAASGPVASELRTVVEELRRDRDPDGAKTSNGNGHTGARL
jgi:anti-anti-sigma factor